MNKMLAAFVLLIASVRAGASEHVWIEAEHLDGVRDYCWPLGKPEMRVTKGNWGLSGPGWAAEWNQGGESGFLSIATGADDDQAVATKTIEIPVAGTYYVWVRYGDWREKTERFQVQLEQTGGQPWVGRYGEQPAVDEDNEMKLYFGWAFAWAKQQTHLEKGPAKLSLKSTTKDPEPRQIDVIVVTNDGGYRPRIKERPRNYNWELLDKMRHAVPDDLEPLARRAPNYELPAQWKVRTFKDKGFLYLWNIKPPYTWLGDDPNRVAHPYYIGDADVRSEFEKMYGGKSEVPIFSDPRIVPTFYGVGPAVFATDPATGEVADAGQRFAKWLDQHPDRPWAMMMNYAGDTPIGEKGIQMFQKYRDRYIGSIAGESLGYFYVDEKVMKPATAAAETRRQVAQAFTPPTLAANQAKYRSVFGRDLDPNPYADVISCLSVGNIVFAPFCFDWGARTVGYESAAATSAVLNMRWAFMRGAARQNEGLTATYRSCNFGDSSTIFSEAQSFTKPSNLLDNYYSVYSGAGMTWYKMDIWYQYMAGSSMFYHEQGHDEYWKPGGLTAAGVKEAQLSPKGKLVDRFLRVTAEQPDRGSPFTPIAFLVDYAHGWEPAPFWPNSFKNWHGHQEKFRPGDHEKMLEEYFWTAYHPIGPKSEAPITGTSEVYLPGVFGDIFDVVFAYPDVNKWRTIDTYPVVIVNGDIELTEAEGKRLANYVVQGGTLLVADAQLTGPGVSALSLPQTDRAGEADSYNWMGGAKLHPAQLFRYKRISDGSGRPLATTAQGDVFCAAFDRGAGRLIYLSVPRGLSIGRQAIPVVGRLFAHLSRKLMPVEVVGDVQWLVNRTSTGWAVTLLNPAGQDKPQQGITPTDYRQNRLVTIKSRVPVTTAVDRLLKTEALSVTDNRVVCKVPAGAVRIIELR